MSRYGVYIQVCLLIGVSIVHGQNWPLARLGRINVSGYNNLTYPNAFCPFFDDNMNKPKPDDVQVICRNFCPDIDAALGTLEGATTNWDYLELGTFKHYWKNGRLDKTVFDFFVFIDTDPGMEFQCMLIRIVKAPGRDSYVEGICNHGQVAPEWYRGQCQRHDRFSHISATVKFRRTSGWEAGYN